MTTAPLHSFRDGREAKVDLDLIPKHLDLTVNEGVTNRHACMKNRRKSSRRSEICFPRKTFCIRWFAAIVVISLLLFPTCILAWNPFKAAGNLAKSTWDGAKDGLRGVGSFLGSPVGGFIGSATAPTINQAESAGHRLIEDVDKRMETRMNQLDKVLDTSIGKIDLTLEKRIGQMDDKLKERITQVDVVLKDRIGQIDGVLGRSIADVDQLLAGRLSQLDEIAEKRIGNIDVVASKATLTLEESLLRFLGMACLMVFLAAAVWRMYVEWTRVRATVQQPTLLGRFSAFFKLTWRRVAGQVALVGVLLSILYCAFAFLPGGPRARAASLATIHKNAFAATLNAFDLQRARYHAAQLQIIDPVSVEYRGMGLKAELIRDIFSRPALLQSATGVNQIAQRVTQVEQLLGAEVDPDLMVLKAYVHWRSGTTRADEFQAAEYASAALNLGREAFPLKDLAFSILANYCLNPLPDDLLDVAKVESQNNIKATLAKHLASQSNSSGIEFRNPTPLEYVVKYNEFVRNLERSSMTAYLNMLDGHVAFRVEGSRTAADQNPKLIEANKNTRRDGAAAVVGAWDTFMGQLHDQSLFEGTSAPLAAFLLNDAVQMRALSYRGDIIDVTEDIAPAVLLAAVEKRKDLTAKLTRVRIEKEFPHLLPMTSRDLVDFQESERFFGNELKLVEFEKAYLDFQRALGGTTAMQIVKTGLAAAEKASAANLYDYRGPQAQPVSRTIFQKMEATLQANYLKTGDAKALVEKSVQEINSRLLARRGEFL